jgi:hypothetical protein
MTQEDQEGTGFSQTEGGQVNVGRNFSIPSENVSTMFCILTVGRNTSLKQCFVAIQSVKG